MAGLIAESMREAELRKKDRRFLLSPPLHRTRPQPAALVFLFNFAINSAIYERAIPINWRENSRRFPLKVIHQEVSPLIPLPPGRY